MLRKVRGLSLAPFLEVLHYLFAVPLFVARSLWISTATGVGLSAVSIESCDVGFDLLEAGLNLVRVVKAQPQCGVCLGSQGHYVLGDTARIYDRMGCRNATCFNFQCESQSCNALCGVFTCSLPGSESRHVLSSFVAKADVYLPLRKPNQRKDEFIGYGRDLIEEMTDHGATHKSFEAFVLCYNRTQESESRRKGLIGHARFQSMHHHTFRNAWFACTALDKSFELGRPPFNVLLFTKRESGGHGAFEGFLEEINGPLSQAFTTRWVKHSTELCGVGHKVLVGDGHMKTHFECCNNKNGASLVDPTLGVVNLACARWPGHLNGKKLSQCFQCIIQNTVKVGVGQNEMAPIDDVTYLKGLIVESSDISFIGKSWKDRDSDSIVFTLRKIEWVLLDSSDGSRLPTLVGYYSDTLDVNAHLWWSTMGEIKMWISSNAVTGPLSDRECRAMRRAASADTAAPRLVRTPRQVDDDSADNDDEQALLNNHLRNGYVFQDILQSAIMPDGMISYQVAYEIPSHHSRKKIIQVWEPSSVVPVPAIERFKQRQLAFRYTPEEVEVQKNCAGSLKEGQKQLEVVTSAGIFVAILNCGIIISVTMLFGAESLSQIYVHLTNLYEVHGDYLPDDFGYDAGCHLRKFAELRKDKTPRAMSFWMRIGRFIFVDRFHWRNHKNTHKYCQEFCNPNENDRLDGANTEICEQSFRWFARHKYSINNMTPARFRFFLTILADRRNEILIAQRGHVSGV